MYWEGWINPLVTPITDVGGNLGSGSAGAAPTLSKLLSIFYLSPTEGAIRNWGSVQYGGRHGYHAVCAAAAAAVRF